MCHAYQILRKGGLKDENIIVFMYDDIAFSEYNPRPGIIINRPQGEDVYEGVPKVLFFIGLKSPLSEYGHNRFSFFIYVLNAKVCFHRIILDVMQVSITSLPLYLRTKLL